jgi:hypothetical protein
MQAPTRRERDELPPIPTNQGDLFRPMCGQSVAAQRELFGDETGEPPSPPDGPRIADLPGQTYFA